MYSCSILLNKTSLVKVSNLIENWHYLCYFPGYILKSTDHNLQNIFRRMPEIRIFVCQILEIKSFINTHVGQTNMNSLKFSDQQLLNVRTDLRS